MAWEGQIAMALVGLMPDNKVLQSGFLLVMGLAIFIESPVIDLLSTGTTLGTTKARFHKITRFTLILMAWVTFAHCAVVFTPLYNIVAIKILDAEPEAARAAWQGLAWMPIWSACVGWRRYRQGIMIRAGITKLISWGTLIRIVSLTISGAALYYSGTLSGLALIGCSFTISVLAEAAYIHLVSQPIIANLPSEHPPLRVSGEGAGGEVIPSDEPGQNLKELPKDLSFLDLAKFHIPLTVGTMLMLTAPVLVTRALNLTPEPILATAAWQVAATVGWLFRTITFALPEAIISLYHKSRERILANFCLKIGLTVTILMVALHLLKLDIAIFRAAFKCDQQVAEIAAVAFIWTAPLPLLNSVMAYYRGLLTIHEVTIARFAAILVALISLTLALIVGVRLNLNAPTLAGSSLVIAHLVELATLALAWKLSAKNPPHRALLSDPSP
jgi:hypothetical protein